LCLNINSPIKKLNYRTLYQKKKFKDETRRTPKRELNLINNQIELALKNALRYIPEHLHEKIASEFLDELLNRDRIYGYRYRPQGRIKAKHIDQYKANTIEGKAIQLMIDNNLDFDVALYLYELVIRSGMSELDAVQINQKIYRDYDK